MKIILQSLSKSLCVVAMLALCVSAGFAQQGRGNLRGLVADEFGAPSSARGALMDGGRR